MPNEEILTIQDVAKLLRIGEKTTYTMAQTGRLPGFKVGGQWRFRRSDIDAWIGEQVTGGNSRRHRSSGAKKGSRS